jgi:tRNA G18 (ribose-2'-O)-methylase SpoU
VHCHTSFPIGHYTKKKIIRKKKKKKKLKKKAIGDNVVEVIFIMPKNIKRIFITKPMKIISIGQHMHSFPHTNIKTCTIIEKPTKKNLPIGMT